MSAAQLRAAMLADLARSGLTPADAKKMQVREGHIGNKQGYDIPYFDEHGASIDFRRFRYLEDSRDSFSKLVDGKPIKYKQPANTLPQIYYAPHIDWGNVLADHAIDIVITEGEKKAAAACKAGIPTIALGGVDSFQSKKRNIELLPDFEKWKAHRLVICYDSDATTNPDIVRAEETLAMRLKNIGAHVSIARIPQLNGHKIGIDDFIKAHGAKKFKTEVLARATTQMRFKLLSGEELCNAPPMEWLVHGVLPRKGLASLYGPSGVGKGFLVLDFGCAVARGEYEWFGHRITKAPVTYLCLEGAAGLGKRIKAKKLHSKKALPDALHFVTQPFDLLSDDVEELARAIIAANGADGMVIIDTLNRAAPGCDENSSVDMGRIISAAEQLQILVGGLVLLVHHTGKDVARGLRGHSSLRGALDGAIEVTKNDTGRAWINSKAKDSEDGAVFPFELKIVAVGKDEIGLDITSCVVAQSAQQSRLERNAEEVLRCLIAAVNQGRPVTQNGLSKLGTGLGRDALRDAVRLLIDTRRAEYRPTLRTGKGGAHEHIYPLSDPQETRSPTAHQSKTGEKREKF